MIGDEFAKTHILRLDPERFASAPAANRHISGALRFAGSDLFESAGRDHRRLQRQLRGEASQNLLVAGRRACFIVEDRRRSVAAHLDAIGDAGQAEHASVGEFEAPGAVFLDVNFNAQRAASHLERQRVIEAGFDARPFEGFEVGIGKEYFKFLSRQR